MKNVFAVGLSAAIALAISGCATSPEKIQSASVSPLQYKDYTCNQVSLELDRVTRRANELHGKLKKLSDDDSGQMAVGLILFWPALFFLEGGDGPDAAEYARLKGERDALEKIAVEKNCARDTVLRTQDATKPAEESNKPADAPRL